MKGKKMVIAVILALIVCLVLIPTCAFATDDEPEVKEEVNNNPSVVKEVKAVEEKTSTTEADTDAAGGNNSGKTDGVVVSPAPTQTPAPTQIPVPTESPAPTETPATTENTSGNAGYTVEFTVGEKTYTLKGDTSVDLDEILGVLGIDGSATTASSSEPNYFSVGQKDDGVWFVTAENCFSSEQNLTVEVSNGETSETIIIVVTDNGAVAKIEGSTTEYTSLQEAINAATDGVATKIVLTANVEESVTIEAGKTITIDLNGYTLKSKTYVAGNWDTPTIKNSGNLTIKDSTGNGTIDSVYLMGAAILNMPGGVLTVESGNITRSKDGDSDYDGSTNTAYTVQNCGTMTVNGGNITNPGGYSSVIGNKGSAKITITGGTFTGGKHTVNNDAGGTVTITGGTFTNNNTNRGKAGADTVKNEGTMTISGGKFIYNGMNPVVVNTNDGNVGGNMTITGGEFTGTVTNKVGVNVVNVLTVTGGTFNDKNVKNYVPTAGYDIAENGSTYVVSKHVDPTPAVEPVVVPTQTTETKTETTKKDDTLVEAKKDNATEQSSVTVEGTTAKITVTDNKGELIAPQEVTIKSVTALESTGATEASIQLDTKLVLDLDVATIKSASTSDVVTVTNEENVITVKSGETALVSVDVKAVLSETEQTVTVKFSENTVKVVCGDTAYSIDLSELGDVGTLTLKLENGVLKVYDKDGNLLKEIEKA